METVGKYKVKVEEGKDFGVVSTDSYEDPSVYLCQYVQKYGKITYLKACAYDGNYIVSHEWKDIPTGEELVGTFVEGLGTVLATVEYRGQPWVLIEADEGWWLDALPMPPSQLPKLVQFVPAEDGEGILIPDTWWATFDMPNEEDIAWQQDFWTVLEEALGCRVKSMDIVGVQHFEGKVQVMVGCTPASADFKIPTLGGSV